MYLNPDNDGTGLDINPPGPEPNGAVAATQSRREPEPLLQVSDLRVYFNTAGGVLKAVDGVSFEVGRGETLGLVGESGCGKSITAYSILRLVPVPPGVYAGGAILFKGTDLLKLGERQIDSVRGSQISIVFQEPTESLNPIMTIGNQISEVIVRHRGVSKREARDITIEMLRRVGIGSPERRFRSYPHELSGGMIQRAMIAMSLVCGPELLIADEPTTALDVTIQAQILELLGDLRRDLGMSVLMITHDLGVVAQISDRVAVMYAGKIVEYAAAGDLFDQPKHPYTHGLFRSLPRLTEGRTREPLPVIPGTVPNPSEYVEGCRFRPRCPIARDICGSEPRLREISPGHLSACHFAEHVATLPAGSLLSYG
jgi:oligopeptide/dipeptide ABC transporter ATP-binding protein